MWVKAGGYSLTGPSMSGRQIAWIRRANDGAWIACFYASELTVDRLAAQKLVVQAGTSQA